MTDSAGKTKFRRLLIALVASLAIGAKTGLVLAQCDFDWKPGEGLPDLDGYVYALTTWDPDGNGPQEELLIAGGWFTKAGDVLANSIAAWDGNSCQALGSGMNTFVHALTVYNGELIAGGEFTIAGGGASSHWARWGLPEVYTGDLNHDCLSAFVQWSFSVIFKVYHPWGRRLPVAPRDATGYCPRAV